MLSRRRKASTGPDSGIRAMIWGRCGGRCEICGRDVNTGMVSIHHRKPRRMGGTSDPLINDPSNLMLVCGSGTTGCHGKIESNRTAAYQDGYLLHSGQDSSAIPARIHGKGFRLLTSDGAYKALWE